MLKIIRDIPRFVVSFLLVAAIVNLLIGVFLRYVMIEVTDWLDVDPIRFTWVEEVGEMMLAWLTLIGAAIGVRERVHFTLHVLHLSPAAKLWVERIHHLLGLEGELGSIGHVLQPAPPAAPEVRARSLDAVRRRRLDGLDGDQRSFETDPDLREVIRFAGGAYLLHPGGNLRTG